MMEILMAILTAWLLAFAAAGYRRSFSGFALVLVAGITLNILWIIYGIGANPLDIRAIGAHVAATLYGAAAFGLGWLVRRIRDNRRDGQAHTRAGQAE